MCLEPQSGRGLRTPATSERQRRARTVRSASARRSALRADSPSVLGPVARRATRCAHCVRCARAGAPSQTTKRADARSHGPCVPRRLAGALRPARTRLCRYGGGSPQENIDIRRLSALRSTSQVTSHKSQVASRKSQSQSQSQCSAVQCSAVELQLQAQLQLQLQLLPAQRA